jgi:hypothetical protein
MKEAESAAKTMAANALKGRIDWNKYPKLADIFEHRSSVNVYWHELVTLLREHGAELCTCTRGIRIAHHHTCPLTDATKPGEPGT